MQFYLLVEREFETQFMQRCGVFESFKCLCVVIEAETDDTQRPSAKLLFDKLSPDFNNGSKLAGVLVRGGDSYVVPGRTVFSGGTKFATIEQLCSRFNSKWEPAREEVPTPGGNAAGSNPDQPEVRA